jgi:agmatine deiminase
MPAEWEPHERTWMAFPTPNATFGPEGSDTLNAARNAWAGVAKTIARYEPVALIANVDDGPAATALTGGEVTVIERPLDDAWMRDTGPTFTKSGLRLGAVDWVFNGWGAQSWATWDRDARLASDIGLQIDAEVQHSKLTNEGGGLHVDGAGTVLLTDTVQLDPNRNPGWTREQVESEVHARLGTTHAIWLPRGLTRDYSEFGTRGHVDIVATFVSPGLVAAHSQLDPVHPDFPVTKELIAMLRSSTDATGQPLEVVEIPAPTAAEVDDDWTDFSYINHYVGNGFVVVGIFDDPNDDVALDLLARLYPNRRVERADGRSIFAYGGGVHCITQQQPR